MTLKEYSRKSVEQQTVIYWPKGDREWQQLRPASSKDLALDLKLSALLADVVLQSASYFYESLDSRNASRKNWDLLTEGHIINTVGEEFGKHLGDYYDHSDKKALETPAIPDYHVYHSSERLALAKELERTGKVFQRVGDLSKEIETLWLNDCEVYPEDDNMSILSIVWELPITQSDKKKVLDFLKIIPRQRDMIAFVWEYIESKLRDFCSQIPHSFMHKLKERHMVFYYVANAALTGAVVPDSTTLGFSSHKLFLRPFNPFNTSLFVDFCEVLGIREAIVKIKPTDVLFLKGSPEFKVFLKQYISLVQDCDNLKQALDQLIKETSTQLLIHNVLSPERSKVRFLQAWRETCEELNLPRGANEKYLIDRPSDEILREEFNKIIPLPIIEFKNRFLKQYQKDGLISKIKPDSFKKSVDTFLESLSMESK